MVMEDGLIPGGGHRMQYTDQVPQKCTLKTSMILLTNTTPINLKSESILTGKMI